MRRGAQGCAGVHSAHRSKPAGTGVRTLNLSDVFSVFWTSVPVQKQQPLSDLVFLCLRLLAWLLILIFTPVAPRKMHPGPATPTCSLCSFSFITDNRQQVSKNHLFPEDDSQRRTVSVIDSFRCRFTVKNSLTCKVGGSVGGLEGGGGAEAGVRRGPQCRTELLITKSRAAAWRENSVWMLHFCGTSAR